MEEKWMVRDWSFKLLVKEGEKENKFQLRENVVHKKKIYVTTVKKEVIGKIINIQKKL